MRGAAARLGRAFVLTALLVAIGSTGCSAGSAPSSSAKPKLPDGTYVTVDGAKLWYISEGKGDPVVIISGGPGAAHYLYPYFSKLADKHRVIYLDSYGSGKSERATSPELYTFKRHVDEIEGLRKQLGYDKITVVGHSYGGIVAQAFAIKYPASVNKLVIMDAPHSAEMEQASLDLVNQLVKSHYPEVWQKLMEMRSRSVSPLSKEWTDATGQIPPSFYYDADFTNSTELLEEDTPGMYYAIYGPDADFIIGGEMKGYDFRPGLKNLKMPVLVVVGRMDRFAPPVYALQFKDLIPGSKLVILEKSGHNVFQEENARMITVLREFLE